jgi:serine/threonine protein kinase
MNSTVTWKILWDDARNAAAQGDSDGAADFFTRSLQEAQSALPADDPLLQVLLKERNEFYKIYGSQIRTFQKIEKPSKHDHVPQHAVGEDEQKGKSTIWKLCSRCGRSSKLCRCTPLKGITIDSASNFEPGDLIAKRYQVVRTLGVGGMAIVYLVRNAADKLLAMKILNGEYTNDHEANERFEREARIIRRMRHRGIISVFDFGKMPDGRAYFVMEFVEGESLLSVLEREVQLSMARTCRIFLQICDAMAHAHNIGIVHRDLTPSNVVLLSECENSDQVKIVDFGIAQINQTWSETDSRLTKEGQIFGSPAYMSPEQCLGQKIDHRSDIYSVGCVMYQSLCGVPPFTAEHLLALLYKHVNETLPTAIPVSSGKISPKLEKIVLRTLCKDPNERYQSMVDMESELLEFMIEDEEITL